MVEVSVVEAFHFLPIPCFSLQSPVEYTNQPNAPVASEGHHVVMVNILVKRTAREVKIEEQKLERDLEGSIYGTSLSHAISRATSRQLFTGFNP
jgi:hypothetical protein